MKEKKISVIVPVYNTKKYLNRCLDSIVRQIYENLEIICIDDGSNDGSEKIVDEYAKKDDRFIVIHQPNGGESKARNTGIKLITGDYVAFVDCDDYLEPQMYERLVYMLENSHADMAACSYSKDSDGIIEPAVNIGPIKEGVWEQHDLLKYVYQRDAYRGVTGYIWCKLYRKEILKDKQGEWILFNENLVLGGDILYFADVALNTKKIIYTSKPYYHYIQRDSSGFHSEDEYKWSDMIKTYQLLLERLIKANVDEKILLFIKRFLVYRGEVVAQKAFQHKNKEVLQYSQKVMKKYEHEYRITNKDYPERLDLFNEIMSYKI